MRRSAIIPTAIIAMSLACGVSVAAAATTDERPQQNVAEQSRALASETGESFTTSKDSRSLYRVAIDEFPLALPPGEQWPVTLPTELTDPNALYEEGYIEGRAVNFWMCSWSKSTLSSIDRGDAAAVASGVAMLDAYTELPWTQENFPDRVLWHTDVVKPVSLGDAAALRESTPTACAL